MNTVKTIGICLVLLFLASVLLACGAPTEPSIEVEEPWARPAMIWLSSRAVGIIMCRIRIARVDTG